MTQKIKMHVPNQNHLPSSHSLSPSATYHSFSLLLSSTTISLAVSSSTLLPSSTPIDPAYAVHDDSKEQTVSRSTGFVTFPSIGTSDQNRFNPILDQNNISTDDTSTIRPAQIVILVVGLLAGMAFIISAMFLIFRKKRTKSNKGSRDDRNKQVQENRRGSIPELVIVPSRKAADVKCELKTEDDKNRLVNDLSSTSGTLVDDMVSGQNSFKKDCIDHNHLQRDSWQTFVTCETARTEEIKDEEHLVLNHSMSRMIAKRRRVPVYQAQLAHPLLAYY